MADEIEPCTHPLMDVSYILAIGATIMSGLALAPASTFSITYNDEQGNLVHEYETLLFAIFDSPDQETIVAFTLLLLAWLSGACFSGIYGAFSRVGVSNDGLPRILSIFSLSFACLGVITSISLWFAFSSDVCVEANTCHWETGAYLILATSLAWYTSSTLLLASYCCRYFCWLGKVHVVDGNQHQDA